MFLSQVDVANTHINLCIFLSSFFVGISTSESSSVIAKQSNTAPNTALDSAVLETTLVETAELPSANTSANIAVTETETLKLKSPLEKTDFSFFVETTKTASSPAKDSTGKHTSGLFFYLILSIDVLCICLPGLYMVSTDYERPVFFIKYP